MRCPRSALLALALALALLAALSGASAASAAVGSSSVAALQVALAERALYRGAVDGVAGAETGRALREFQERNGLVVDGIAGPRTRAAFGAYGRWSLGARTLHEGQSGWDVAELQFLLAWQGFPSGRFTGVFEERVAGAVRRFQRWSGLDPDAVAGERTIALLQAPPPAASLTLAPPVSAPLVDRFGPRGDRFHTGLDFPAAHGAPVVAAAAGRVTYADWLPGGWGYEVTVDHGNGFRSMYAHLSTIGVRLGAAVAAGQQLGAVGASGAATGPHLHFELRLRGAAVDPLPALALLAS